MLKKVFKHATSNNFNFFLLCVIIGGIYLFFDRPSVQSQNDVVEVEGTLMHISKQLVYSNRINKTESDSTYHIHLKEYPSKFQVSYSSYDGRAFYSTSNVGDRVKLHIAGDDKVDLNNPDKRIRSFSLIVNEQVYLSLEKGLTGFGKGIFELVLIFLPLSILAVRVDKKMRKERQAITKPKR
ncbi:hypothetical protein [uncultured Pontibacter sp.]|uniref:hypothetical protein n=1 Tax=uncultured Pontibacter sp. TaxID=453356 RepID=UPI0026098123|nr:hypothetical protein [uncultured Pontibacter sp.]